MARSPFLLVSDLDDTLVGTRPEDRRSLEVLSGQLEDPDITLVYATGRSPTSATELIAEVQLPIPAALVTSVGTTIFYADDPLQPDLEWWEQLKPGWDAGRIDALALDYAPLSPQPAADQGPYKRSFFLAPQDSQILPALARDLEAAGLRVRVIYSSERDLDILPVRGDKGQAVRYLQQRWGFSADQTVVCGDSGNDQSLFEVGSLGIAVGNARCELVAWLDAQPNAVYRASRRCAAGILEGLQHWQLL